MKGKLHPANDETINPSGNESVREVLRRVDRRRFIEIGLGAPVLAALGGVTIGGLVNSVEAAPIPPGTAFAGLDFESIPPSLAPVLDRVTVPPGYDVDLLVAWGDPVTPEAEAWDPNVAQNAEAQAQQFGMHCDGMHFFPFRQRGRGAEIEGGLLVVNHEYTHESILHAEGLDSLTGGLPFSVATIQKVRKSQAAHGVAVVELRRVGRKWRIVRNSRYARRITANTPMRLSGPAAGSALLKTIKYNITPTGSQRTGSTTDGTECWGTANNCAHGYTPWGTYLTCEENWNGYFGWKNPAHVQTALEKRYGVTIDGFTINTGSGNSSIYKWHVLDDRFDADITPNEANTFGWKVEIDPADPNSVPVKRTALGRFKPESAALATDPNHRFAYYSGDDERNEYIYKWVCAKPYDPDNRAANKDLLDEGTLYAAKFSSAPGLAEDTYRGSWLPLTPGSDSVIPKPGAPGTFQKLRELPQFAGANDAEVLANILVKTRMAADAVGATMMDRPEWCAVRPRIRGFQKLEVYCTLTNNSRRGNTPVSSNNPDGSTSAATANPPVDGANPRPDNDYGHIIRWREDGDSVTATAFEWDIFVLCGDTRAATHTTPKRLGSSYTPAGHDGYTGNIHDNPGGSADFGAPDGLWFDQFGRLWIQTDQMGDALGDWQKIGANTMLCADPNTKEIRRFLTGPNRCEVTGVINTPDGTTMFVGIQHPGEESPASDPDAFSSWPANQFGGPGGRPRSSVLQITRKDGGVIGASDSIFGKLTGGRGRYASDQPDNSDGDFVADTVAWLDVDPTE